MLRQALEDLRARQTYTRIAYLLLALPLGVAEFAILVSGLSFGFGSAITLVGLPVLLLMLFIWRWMAQGERRLIGALVGIEIADPYRRPPPGASRWRLLRGRLADPATWKDLVFLVLQLPAGIVAFTLTVIVLGGSAALLAAPIYHGSGFGLGVDTVPETLALVPLGALLLFAGIPALGALGRLYGWFAVQLLGSNEDPELTAEVSELRGAQARVIAATDAERRRLERDLHDGAQQRLVSLALTLRVAEQRAEKGEPGAPELMRDAREEVGKALEELRDLARGIHPAILTNRGLADALRDLAGRAAVPVEVTSAPSERLPEPVEAAAYFVVSECLANIGKHAHASQASVAVSEQGAALAVEVRDDGSGGASLDGGSGLQGLRDRVAALDGRLELHSPPGEGTLIRALLPLDGHAPGGRPAAAAPRALSDEEADAVMERRRRMLRPRLVVLGAVALVLLLLWAVTGAGSFWPIWPLIGLGLVAAIDSWGTLASGPLRESALPAPGAARDQAVKQARIRRSLALAGGVLLVIDTTVVALWLASGAGYFWPGWVLFGSALIALPGALLVRSQPS